MNAAIIGCGSVANTHARVLHEMDGVTPVAFADIEIDRARSFAERFGGKSYPSLDVLLDEERVDVLHICTPHSSHVPMMTEAAERGIAVFCEKPPLTKPEEREALCAAEGKVPVGICFQNRYNPESLQLREKLLSCEAGAIKGARAFVTWSRDAGYYAGSGGWRGKKQEAGGGVLMNQAVHTLDLLVWLLGRPQRVSAAFSNHLHEIEVEDTAELWLHYPDKRAVLYATTAYTQDAPNILEIHCERETYRIDAHHAAGEKAYWGTGHAACIADFYRCLRKGEPFALSPSKLSATIDTLLAAYQQASSTPSLFLSSPEESFACQGMV